MSIQLFIVIFLLLFLFLIVGTALLFIFERKKVNDYVLKDKAEYYKKYFS